MNPVHPLILLALLPSLLIAAEPPALRLMPDFNGVGGSEPSAGDDAVALDDANDFESVHTLETE